MSEENTAVTTTVDVTGMNCPIPIIKAKQALKGLEPGALLEVIATDPASEADFEAFAKQTGNELIESTRDGEKFIYKLKKT